MFNNEIKWCYFGIGCVFCVLHFLELLTTYTLFTCIVAASVVHYYFYKRNENFRHRLSVLGLVKHDKRERKVNSLASQNCVHTNSWKDVAERPARTTDTSLSSGHFNLSDNFVARRRSLSASWSRESSAFTNSLSFVNKSIVEQQRKHTFSSRSPRKSSLDWEPAFHKRYPVQQEKYAVGKYPAVCLTRSPLPTAKLFGEQDGSTLVKVKIHPLASSPKQHIILSTQTVENNNEASKQDPCSTEAVLKALKERRKRAAVSCQDDADKGEASKRQRKENPMPPTSALPTPTYCPAPVLSFGGTTRSRASEKRPYNSAHESPGDGPKRVRNNAIFSSFCSSRSLVEAGQTHKRKASTCETPPQMKITKKEDRTTPLSAGSNEAEAVIEEKTATNPVQEQKDEEITSPTCETTVRSSTSIKREFLPSDQSVRKKKLVFPEHVATMQEHEQDSLLEKQRLNLMLGSINRLYQSSKPDVTSMPHVEPSGTTQVPPKGSTGTTAQPVTQAAFTTSVTPTLLSTSTQVTEALKKSPTVTFGVSPSGLMGSTQPTGAQLPLMNTSTSCVTVPKMAPPATVTRGTSLQIQTPCSKTGAASTLPDSTFLVTAASTAIGQCTTAITHTSPALSGFSHAPISVTPVVTSSKTGVLPPIAGTLSPLAPPKKTAPPKIADTPTRSAGEISKGTPFAFGSTSVPSFPFTFGAQVATSSHSPAANSFCTPQATNPTAQAQGFVFSAPSRTPQPFAVSSTVTTPSKQVSAGKSLLTPTSSVLGISQAPPTSVLSITQGGVKFTPAASGGFSFATTPVPSRATSSVITNGVNGFGSSAAPTAPVFKFGSVNTSNAPTSAAFNFSAQQQNSTLFAPKQNIVLGSAPSLGIAGGPVSNNLFSIGSAARSERPMAIPRSKRSVRK